MLSPGQSAMSPGPECKSFQVSSPVTGIGQGFGGGGESREIQPEGHTLNSTGGEKKKEKKKTTDGFLLQRQWSCGGVSKQLDRYALTLDFDIQHEPGEVIKVWVSAQK